MKFGSREKKKLIEILDERSGDFVDRNGTHKEKWVQYLQMIGILPQPCDLRPRKGLVMFKAGFFSDPNLCWFSVPEEVATRILVLGFAPPRNRRREKKVEYRLERNGRSIAVGPTSESVGSKMMKFLMKGRPGSEFAILDPAGKVIVKVSRSRSTRQLGVVSFWHHTGTGCVEDGILRAEDSLSTEA